MPPIRSSDGEPVDARSLSIEQGRYKVIASLGQGGMADIFLAVMSGPARFSKLLVLKVLRQDLDANQEELVTMFLDEARVAARLQHRNLVQTYEFGEISGRYYMVMEYLEGQSLRALQRKIAPDGLPLAEELYILAETARGLHHAHELRGLDGVPMCVVHRDISPQNVLVTYDGEVKLLDFGIAKTAGADHLTQVGVIKGKVDYIAPEQVRADAVDRRADIFSLGAMLWEAITKGRFGGGIKVAEVTKFHKRLTGGESNVRAVRPEVPEELATIVDRAIALDPDQRFATAEQFADSIEAYLDTLPTRPSQRSLAELLVQPFADERDKLRKRIEQQVQRLQAKDRLSERPSSGSRTLDLTVTMSGVLDLSPPGSGPRATAELPTNAGKGLAKPRPASWKMPVVAVSGLLLVAAAGSALIGGGQNPPSATIQSPHAPTAAAPTTPAGELRPPTSAPLAAERTVSFMLDVSPSTARVTLDGALLPRLPFAGSFPIAGETHLLEARAEGFQMERRLVTFDRDQTIKLALRAAMAPVRAHARRSHATTADDAAQAPFQASSAPPMATSDNEQLTPGVELKLRPRQREFDMSDPYAE